MDAVRRILGESVRRPTKRELTDPWHAFWYARDVVKGPWPMGEEVIARDGQASVAYASECVGGRWPLGEKTILKDPNDVLDYVLDVVRQRWPEGEKAIATCAEDYGEDLRHDYLELYPEAEEDWILNGWTERAGWFGPTDWL